MSGWHTRLWRRVRLAPGVTINLSKSGPSVSVGPRGSKITFGRRGVRQTVGIPGTGIYATRQVSSPRARARSAPGRPATTAATDAATFPDAAPGAAVATDANEVELYYGFATVVGIVFGIVLAVLGVPAGQAVLGAVVAVAVGIAYEGLAHHHPGPAKALAQVVVAGATHVTIVLGLVVAVAIGGALASSRRSRRSPW